MTSLWKGAVNLVSDAVDWTTHTADDIVQTIGLPPLVSQAEGVIVDLVKGPLRDFARTDIGRVVLRAFATGLYYQLGPTLGPQFAAVTFAVPGLLRGEDFDEAWTTEFLWRLTTSAAILAGMYFDSKADFNSQSQTTSTSAVTDNATAAGQRLKEVFDTAAQIRDVLKKYLDVDVLSLDYHAVARELHVREDVLLEAFALVKRDSRALATYCTNAVDGSIISC